MDEAQRQARNKYAREWREKNKDRVNAQRRKRDAEHRVNDPEFAERARERNHKYEAAHRDERLARRKSKNWYYNSNKRVEIRERYYDKDAARSLLRQRKAYAKKKELPFTLTNEWWYEEYEKGCAVTGIPFDPPRSDTPWVSHIDRIIPEEGYTIDNCRLVCACFNLAKKHWTDEDVLKMAYALVTRDATG